MTLLVEDGTLVDGAESYISVEYADMYFANRGVSTWSILNTTEKEQALRRATDYMLARYRGRWKGSKVKYAQALDWPRVGVTPDDSENPISLPSGYSYGYRYVIPYTTLPEEVKKVCAEYALRAAAGPLLDDQTQKVLQETVGPITTKYDSNSPAHTQYLQADMTLAPLLSTGGGCVVKLRRS